MASGRFADVSGPQSREPSGFGARNVRRRALRKRKKKTAANCSAAVPGRFTWFHPCDCETVGQVSAVGKSQFPAGCQTPPRLLFLLARGLRDPDGGAERRIDRKQGRRSLGAEADPPDVDDEIGPARFWEVDRNGRDAGASEMLAEKFDAAVRVRSHGHRRGVEIARGEEVGRNRGGHKGGGLKGSLRHAERISRRPRGGHYKTGPVFHAGPARAVQMGIPAARRTDPIP